MRTYLYIGIVRLGYYELIPSISVCAHGFSLAWLNYALAFQWEKEEE